MTSGDLNAPEGISNPKLAMYLGQVHQWIKGANISFAAAAKHFAEIEALLLDMMEKIDHLHACTEQAKDQAKNANERVEKEANETRTTIQNVETTIRAAIETLTSRSDGRIRGRLVSQIARDWKYAIIIMLAVAAMTFVKLVDGMPIHEQVELLIKVWRGI